MIKGRLTDGINVLNQSIRSQLIWLLCLCQIFMVVLGLCMQMIYLSCQRLSFRSTTIFETHLSVLFVVIGLVYLHVIYYLRGE